MDAGPAGLQAVEAAAARADSGFGGLPLPSVRPQEQLHLLQNCAKCAPYHSVALAADVAVQHCSATYACKVDVIMRLS